MKVLIAGIGNVLRGDDAVGPYIIEHLLARYDFGADVRAADLGTPGLGLADHIAGVATLILIDAMDAANLKPGAAHVITQEEIMDSGAPAAADPHSLSLRDAMRLAELSGGAPQTVSVIGIAVRSCEVGTGLSAEISQAAESILEMVTSELQRLGVPFQPKAVPSPPNLWWLTASSHS